MAEVDLSKPQCNWSGCYKEGKADILVTRGRDGTHYVVGPHCEQHSEYTLQQYPHEMPGTKEILYATKINLHETTT